MDRQTGILENSLSAQQFTLRAMFFWTAALGIYLAILRWVDSIEFQNNYYPFCHLPEFIAEPLFNGSSAIVNGLGFGTGLIVVPLYSLIALLALAVILIKIPRRPYSIDLFLASLLALFWTHSDAGLMAPVLTGSLALIESAIRRLSNWHLFGSTLALSVAFGLYVTVITAEALAQV